MMSQLEITATDEPIRSYTIKLIPVTCFYIALGVINAFLARINYF